MTSDQTRRSVTWFLLHLFPDNSLALYLCGLWVFELPGLVEIQEEVLQQLLGLPQLVRDFLLMLEGQLFLFIFSILVDVHNRTGDISSQGCKLKLSLLWVSPYKCVLTTASSSSAWRTSFSTRSAFFCIWAISRAKSAWPLQSEESQVKPQALIRPFHHIIAVVTDV